MSDFSLEAFLEEISTMYGPAVIGEFSQRARGANPSSYWVAKGLLDEVLEGRTTRVNQTYGRVLTSSRRMDFLDDSSPVATSRPN